MWRSFSLSPPAAYRLARQLTTWCNLNLSWPAYHRVLLDSAFFLCLSSFASPPRRCRRLAFIFFPFHWQDREDEGRFSPACQLSSPSSVPHPARPAVFSSGLIGVGETRTSSQRAWPEQWTEPYSWPAHSSAQIELEIFHLLFSITKGVAGFLDKGPLLMEKINLWEEAAALSPVSCTGVSHPPGALIRGGRGKIWKRRF